MAKKKKRFEESGEEHSDFVPAVFARSLDEARQYQELLNDHDIPALVGTDEELEEKDLPKVSRRKGMTHGVPVLVPEAMLDEASEIIAEKDEIEEEFASEDDEFDDEDDEEEEESAGEEDLDFEEEFDEEDEDEEDDEDEEEESEAEEEEDDEDEFLDEEDGDEEVEEEEK